MQRIWKVLSLVLIGIIGILILNQLSEQEKDVIISETNVIGSESTNNEPTNETFQIEGKIYTIIDGDFFELNPETNENTFVLQYYDPEFFEKNYVKEKGTTYRLVNEDRFQVLYEFREDFEDADSIHDLMVEDLDDIRWTHFTLQSPSTPSIKEYNDLKQCIIQDKCDFIDNRVEPSTDFAHSGVTSLKTFSIPPSAEMKTAKASLSTEVLHYTKGDDVWFSGWFYLKEGRPTTIMDLESTWLKGDSGIRILMTENSELYVELKALDKPEWKQKNPIVFPSGKWVNVKTHFVLDEKNGLVELWQDDIKIIEGEGRTLPNHDTIYNSLEVGTSSNPHLTTTTLYVDDVTISNKPFK